MVWSGNEKENTRWYDRNKVYDEISDEEIEEIWNRDDPDDEPIRLNGKYVWDAAKRVCDFLNAHGDIIHITAFGEYRCVKKVMSVIKEAHNVERKRRQTKRKDKYDDVMARIQRTKALIARIKHGGIEREEIERSIDEIFGKGSHREIKNVTKKETRRNQTVTHPPPAAP